MTTPSPEKQKEKSRLKYSNEKEIERTSSLGKSSSNFRQQINPKKSTLLKKVVNSKESDYFNNSLKKKSRKISNLSSSRFSSLNKLNTRKEIEAIQKKEKIKEILKQNLPTSSEKSNCSSSNRSDEDDEEEDKEKNKSKRSLFYSKIRETNKNKEKEDFLQERRNSPKHPKKKKLLCCF